MFVQQHLFVYGLDVPTDKRHGTVVVMIKLPKAVQFLSLLYEDADLANICNYGIEGKNYVKVSDHIIEYPEGMNAMTNGWGGFINWFGDNDNVYQLAPNTEEYYEHLEDYSLEKALVSNALGYTFDTSSVKTQLAALTSVIDTMKPALECGLVDVETELPAFIEAMKGAGIEEIIAENQRQFDEWLAAKE